MAWSLCVGDPMSFKEAWLEAVQKKKSLLCVGLDPALYGQRGGLTLQKGKDKLDYSLQVIDQVAPFAAAIKPNRQYFRDVDRSSMQKITKAIKDRGMLAIDDAKIADIGSTNEAAFYDAKEEGFDAITYAPFPGNIKEAIETGHRLGLGVISLALMSNPEFALMKTAMIQDTPLPYYIAQSVHQFAGDGLVVGAPSELNHIEGSELFRLQQLSPDSLKLVPGIGAQGGNVQEIIEAFGKLAIINVSRDIFYAKDPAKKASQYQQSFWQHLTGKPH